ncbi:tRNA 2-selenouridine(34) synthase MnmH [Colwellia sp. 12G3]|uniref:tRNA 2-selenouridine(34) synthase MnmH n=1 Tax=Colwellia sp. 12G3 TaxID=2058299 RepID=UPI000C31E450|nr:tRNA 2-selenouridine(34) synthase MnmH [Colwellia sp. 12G3]PKI13961.1 tRNA 2-selenouridine(34) synthase MnmH [Colwellia sp. 12G3]
MSIDSSGNNTSGKNTSATDRIDSSDFRSIIRNKIPLMDVRAPIEFEKGAFEQSINQPLMNNDEREQVGLCYKNKGQAAAITLGNSLVSGQSKASRMAQWQDFVRENPQGYLYCFRGGLRSQTVQRWLKESGLNYPLITGGYKALRQFLLNELEQLALHPFTILAGNTGCGKTPFLAHCTNSLDLEGAAGHRGSSFGGFVSTQSNQITFENKLAEQYIRGNYSLDQRLILEDEGRQIGSVHLPESLRNAMTLAPLVVIEESLDYRLEQIYQEYIIKMTGQYQAAYGIEQGFLAFSEYLKQGLFKVRKRLGTERYGQLNEIQSAALIHQRNSQQQNGQLHYHFDWLKPLLSEYYDPMYQYQLGLKAERIVFRGNNAQCLAYLQQIQ